MTIDRLTPEQEALIPVIRDEWLAHGLSTTPADRDEAMRGVADAYRAAQLDPPRIVVWLDSPHAGAIGSWMLAQLGQVGGQVGGQVWGQVWGQVRDQVWGQVRDQVRDQVRGQVSRAVYGQHEAGYLSFLGWRDGPQGRQVRRRRLWLLPPLRCRRDRQGSRARSSHFLADPSVGGDSMSEREYIVIQQKLWMNETGHGCDYLWDMVRLPSRAAALSHGYRTLDHDDFNVGTLDRNRLVAFGWGDWDFGPGHGDKEPHGGYDLDEIARHICVLPPLVRTS